MLTSEKLTVEQVVSLVKNKFSTKALHYLRAMEVPEGFPIGRWQLWETRLAEPKTFGDQLFMGPARHRQKMTLLYHWHGGNIHSSPEVVMEDSHRELRKHLPICINAYGRVLVTGLGLGCVIRGLLANPKVEHIDVIERDPIVKMINEWWTEKESRVTVHYGDALTYEFPADHPKWDFAWHDVWSDPDAEEPHLDIIHVKLINRFKRQKIKLCRQGAWDFKREYARLLPVRMMQAPNRGMFRARAKA